MRPRILKVMVALVAVVLPIVALATPAQADPPGTFVTLVNTLRIATGVAPLPSDPTMTAVAQQWADTMAAAGTLSHNPNEATQVPSGWSKLGENIGDGYNLAAVFAAFVASPPHFANMVDPAYNRTGVGVATDSKGQVWVVEDLGDYPPPAVPVIVFPTSGSVIFSSAQSFSWQQVTGATIYCLTVGSTEGGFDQFDSGILPASQLSVTVPALPAGETFWVRVYSFVGGTWTWADASFSVA